MAITIDKAALNTFLNNPAGPVAHHIVGLAAKVASRARELAPSRNANLSRSIRVELAFDSRSFYYRVVSDLPYAAAQHEGSRPHPIFPKRSALHFWWENAGGIETFVPKRGGFRTRVTRGGVLIIGKGRVDHPGNPATYYLSRALAQVVGK